MELQVLERDAAKPWLWSISKLDLAAEQADLIKEWVKHLQQRLRGLSYRCVLCGAVAGQRLCKHDSMRKVCTGVSAVCLSCSC